MKRKRHTPEQVIRKLRDADAELSAGKGIAEVCQKLEVSEATFHRWRLQYGGMNAAARETRSLMVALGNTGGTAPLRALASGTSGRDFVWVASAFRRSVG